MADAGSPDDPMSPEVPAEGEDVEMTGGLAEAADEALPGDISDDPPKRISFLDYLRSPMVQLSVGAGSEAVILSAHQDLLTKSPYFEQACAELAASNRSILLPDDDIEAVGSVLEYLYNGEYFPRRIGQGALEKDPSIPEPDSDGSQLLKHARVYTLAEKFKMPRLKSLAHSKIQATTSTARGEISYARYVYSSTSPDDKTIRNPVATFWATRSHVLRHDAEEEFRAMCLEFPQFGFDVLQRVLDQKEKSRGGNLGISDEGAVGVAVGGTPGTGGKGRKRARVSMGGA